MARRKYEFWTSKEGLVRIEGWARDGLTDEQIAKNIGISRSTLAEWKKKYPDISDTLKRGKEIVDCEVENALLKRALGYTYTETRVKRECGKITEEITVEKVVVPDVAAIIFWLKNRRPDKWREKVVFTDETELEKLDDLIGSIDRLAMKN